MRIATNERGERLRYRRHVLVQIRGEKQSVSECVRATVAGIYPGCDIVDSQNAIREKKAREPNRRSNVLGLNELRPS